MPVNRAGDFQMLHLFRKVAMPFRGLPPLLLRRAKILVVQAGLGGSRRGVPQISAGLRGQLIPVPGCAGATVGAPAATVCPSSVRTSATVPGTSVWIKVLRTGSSAKRPSTNSGQMGANSNTSSATPTRHRNAGGREPGEHALFLVEINGFHESLQHDDPRLEDAQTQQQRRQPGPLRRVRSAGCGKRK